MRKSNALFLAGAFMLAFQANSSAQHTHSKSTTKAHDGTGKVAPMLKSMTKGGITLTPFDDSPKFPDATLKMTEPVAGSDVAPGPVNFKYELSNFELTKMTDHDHSKGMANSMKGQHIHLIVDNEPYVALYEPMGTKDLKQGNHVVLSFLSRSYHESLKHNSAYDLRTFTVGKPAEAGTFDVKAPNMFYSRPKGEYVGDDAKKVMLDFYLVNTKLSPNGDKVRATINGTEFMLDRWLPYMMEGLPMGENKIKLELVDKNGKLIPGPYNSVERTFTLKAS